MMFKDYLKMLVDPRWWSMLHSYDKQWDDAINKALDNGDVVRLSECGAQVGSIKVWVANYPYAYGTPYDTKVSEKQPRPSRKTILRLYKAVPEYKEKSYEEKVEHWINGGA